MSQICEHTWVVLFTLLVVKHVAPTSLASESMIKHLRWCKECGRWEFKDMRYSGWYPARGNGTYSLEDFRRWTRRQ